MREKIVAGVVGLLFLGITAFFGTSWWVNRQNDKINEVHAATATAKTDNNCNPNYDPCIPNSSTDLNCPDVGKMVTVIGTDEYHLDADGNGYGCESYE